MENETEQNRKYSYTNEDSWTVKRNQFISECKCSALITLVEETSRENALPYTISYVKQHLTITLSLFSVSSRFSVGLSKKLAVNMAITWQVLYPRLTSRGTSTVNSPYEQLKSIQSSGLRKSFFLIEISVKKRWKPLVDLREL
jgi:hypothetical protein